MLYAIIYASNPVHKFTDEDKQRLLESSVRKNERLEITGFLGKTPKKFFQFIEGPKENVLKLFYSICADPRHRIVSDLHLTELESRLFPDWSMADLDGHILEVSGQAAMLEAFLERFREGSSNPVYAQIVATEFLPAMARAVVAA